MKKYKSKKKRQKTEIDIKYNLKVLWGFLREYKKYMFGLILIIFLLEVSSFFDNFVFKFLVDKANLFSQNLITIEGFKDFLLLIILIFFAVRLLSALFWYWRIELLNKLDSSIMSDLERSSFWHIINLSYRFHINKKTGSMISQFTRGVNKTESLIDTFAFRFLPVIFGLLISVSVIFYFDIITAIILIVMTILFIIVGVIITNFQKIPQNIANNNEDSLKQNISDVFQNIETVKHFAKEKRTANYFSYLSKKLKDSRRYFWGYFSWHAAIQTAILGIGVSAIFYFNFKGFIDGKLTLGSVTLIYAAVWKLIPKLFDLIHGYREFIRNSVDIDALYRSFKEKNEIRDIKNAKNLEVKKGQIEFNHVFFSYPKKTRDKNPEVVLQDFNLNIKSNTKVALVGPSGSGKTTVIKILYRLFDLDKGSITIDGHNISKITQKSLRENMSIVPQEPLLFDNTIYFNISYANPKASKEEVWDAIKFAQLDKFISRLPLKEKTIVGERGVKLSGGEKQRVSIARAILADKPILILDEATSALDSETEKEIQRDLDRLMIGRTTIIIAHRLSTIMKADTIVVLKKGKIIEIGSHAELKNKRGGFYKRLWGLQQGGKL
ncbi:MAG: ABC transporter ATP-binding protein/permease [Nanoarchaeota archaeon]|nr:ABC transporter ATP-binding protein/permease [Nanoarchaeota archaeon]